MKYLIQILFILNGFFTFSQQFIEICEGYNPTFTYFAPTNDPGNNEWQVNGLFYYSEDLTITWDTPGNYDISVIRYSNGCPSPKMSYNVTVSQCPELIYWVPNTFTPNGDEFNTLWGPIFTSGYDDYGFELLVFNRWGNIIWESKDPAGKWDGTFNNKLCPDGIYTWKIVFSVKNTDEKKEIHGFITLIR